MSDSVPTVTETCTQVMSEFERMRDSLQRTDFADPAVVKAAMNASMTLHHSTLALIRALAAKIEPPADSEE